MTWCFSTEVDEQLNQSDYRMLVAHQKKHSRLHDFPGQLHERPLLQEHLETEDMFKTHCCVAGLQPEPVTGCSGLFGFWTYPAWLDDLMLAVEAVLNLHQLLKIILQHRGEEARRDAAKQTAFSGNKSLTPCFMMSFAWLATSFTTLSAAAWRGNIKQQWKACFQSQC